MANAPTKINKSDLKIFPSERLTDNDDGGGMPIGTALTGADNELFDPISSIARVNGGFNTRLVYAGVQRADDEALIGAFMAITKPAKDTSVNYLLTSASRFGELRREILPTIEAYSIATIESRMTLLSTQAKNSKIVQVYQRVGEPLPLVGDVYCLRQDKQGYANIEQYIQVIGVSASDRNFVDGKDRQFDKTVIKLEISQPLNHDFVGVDYPLDGYADAPCKVRETHVADAGKYYGITPLSEAINADTMTIKVRDTKQKIVPTNQAETPLLDLTTAGEKTALIKGAGEVSVNIGGSVTDLHAGGAVSRGTLSLTTNQGNISDDAGTLTLNDEVVGVIDYASGMISLSRAFHSYALKFVPSGVVRQMSDTASIAISLNNRSYNYTYDFAVSPAIGTMTVMYRSGGRWYQLHDTGTGTLAGATQAHGSGSLNTQTGTLLVSLGELPDVGSHILMSYATTATIKDERAGNHKVQLRLSTITGAVSELTVTTGTKTAKLNTAQKLVMDGQTVGQLDGDTLTMDAQAVQSGDITITSTTGERLTGQFTGLSANQDGKMVFKLANTIAKGSLTVSYGLSIADDDQSAHAVSGKINHIAFDDGNGKLLLADGTEVGTVDYAMQTVSINYQTTAYTKKASFRNERFVNGMGYSYRTVFNGWQLSAVKAFATGEVAVSYSVTTSQDTHTISEKDRVYIIRFDVSDVLAMGAIRFSWGNKHYYDEKGVLYTDLNAQTGIGTRAGSIDYASGIAMITLPPSDLKAISVQSLVSNTAYNPVEGVSFATISSPIRPQSLQISAVASDGRTLKATADQNGRLVGTDVDGLVDVEFGVVTAKFGRMVTVTDEVRAMPWFNADDVEDGKIWQPVHVFADTVKYNAVAYSYLPVSSSAVKIDTVRLPQDGRIPIFRRGDTILIGNTQSQNIGSAHSAGQVVNLDRQNLDRICVLDDNGKAVLASLWEYDLEAGTIKWADDVNLAGYQLPLHAHHTIEERNRVSQIDIDGTLTLQFATKRAYPITDTYVSSVLIGGNLAVRVSVPFTQRNWNNVWQDTPVGNQLLNKLNLIDYPMTLTDDGAITDRWLIKWLSGSQFELYSEALGFVLKTDTLQDLSPINPATKKPYFTLKKEAFGNAAPWASQDVIRFDTWGTLMPVWVLCAIQPTANPLQEADGFGMCVFGDTTEA